MKVPKAHAMAVRAIVARTMAVISVLAAFAGGAAMAQSPTQPAAQISARINAADTAWMMAATALVLMMTIPGLALFYAGMVRKKNVLATMAQSLAATALCSILWAAFGYTLVFGGDGSAARRPGSLAAARHGDGRDQSVRQYHSGIPVHALPDDVRRHHGGAGRRRRSPIACVFRPSSGSPAFGSSSSMYRSRTGSGAAASSPRPVCWTSPAVRSCMSMPASAVSSPRSCSARDAATATTISRPTI